MCKVIIIQIFMTEYSNFEYRPYPNTVYGYITANRVQHMYTFKRISETLFIDRHIERNVYLLINTSRDNINQCS